jgi:single-strand DNA-binding protein
MASFNRVILIGILTRDPELSYSPKGTSIASLGLALNRIWSDDNGEKREETTFVDVTLWARLAEVAGQYLRKGAPVFVEGRLQLDRWEQNGQKRSRLRVIGENVQFLDKREATPSAAAASPVRPAVFPPQRSQTAPAPRAPLVEPELDVDPF